MALPCPGCGCTQGAAHSLSAHAVIAALADDDFDRAIASGLLGSLQCDACAADCRASLIAARTQRLAALAARERHRARAARLQQRVEVRAMRRGTTRAGDQAAQPPPSRPGLPAAAAAVLARAKAKAAERGQR